MQSKELLSKSWISCPSQLSDIRKNISDVCRQLSFVEQDINAIVLAIDEACTNIIRYAYNDCRDEQIEITVFTDGKQVIFRLHDFAKHVSKDCLNFEPTPALEPGGLGVQLMQKVMDSVEFIHTSTCKGNLLEMKKDLPKENT